MFNQSYNVLYRCDGETELSDLIDDEEQEATYESALDDMMRIELIETLKTLLTDRDFQYLDLRFGISDRSLGLSYNQMGAVMGCSHETARKNVVRILNMLSNPEHKEIVGRFRDLISS